MSTTNQVMRVIRSHRLPPPCETAAGREKLGGLVADGVYAWFADRTTVVLYSKRLGSVVSSRAFGDDHRDKSSLTITAVKELNYGKGKLHLLLVGCSLKTTGLVYVCRLPTLTTVRCIALPNPVTFITAIENESFDVAEHLCDEFKIMSTVLLVGMATGQVYAVDLRHRHIEHQLNNDEIVVNESRPSGLFVITKNEDCQEVKEMSDDGDRHLAMFINENFHDYCRKQYAGRLRTSVTSVLYVREINTVAIGYSSGHLQLRDCKTMRTIYVLREPQCRMPITHIGFVEPSDDPNNLCYLWVVQSDNVRLPQATMIALNYGQRVVTANGRSAYRAYQGLGVKLEMKLDLETGSGRCISALSVCNVNMAKNETDTDEDCEIRLFAMLMEIRQSGGGGDDDARPKSYMFLFDINQWYKAQMPYVISHLRVSNTYASFVPLPHDARHLDFAVAAETLRPFGRNFRNCVEELYYPSSVYFEYECLLDTELVRLKHAGVQQQILDRLVEKNWQILVNPSLVFGQCLQANLTPFFWDKTDDYANYSLPDQRSFVISVLVENKLMSVLSACAEQWKNGTYASSQATILHLVQCLWNHVMVVKQFADKLCVPLFDYSCTQMDGKNKCVLKHCLSQMQCVKFFLQDLHCKYGVHIITNVDYTYRVYTLNLVTQYFKAVTCFINYGLLPERCVVDNPDGRTVQYDYAPLMDYANKRRTELGNSQLYLIDAVVNHEHRGSKLIEQWQNEGGMPATNGLYPPATVQCLLRIYLNAALSDTLKHYITVYYLIDVCSTAKDLDPSVANRMCNFAIEFDVENVLMNTVCRASWLLDHDMFKEAMEILSGDKNWAATTRDSGWRWFHWTVAKLMVFKGQYFWARYYTKLVDLDMTDVDDHKFHINLEIMNNQYFESLRYIRTRSAEEKPILLRYLFDRCKETDKLRCLIQLPLESHEEDALNAYLKSRPDAESTSMNMLFLLQRGRYSEAVDVNKSLGTFCTSTDDHLTIVGSLVNGFDKSVPKNITKRLPDGFSSKNVYKKTDTVLKRLNPASKSFNILDKIKANAMKLSSRTPFKHNKHTSNTTTTEGLLFEKCAPKRLSSDDDDEVNYEKRRKINDRLSIAAPNVNAPAMGERALEILDTPLVGKTTPSSLVTGLPSSILKTGCSAIKLKRFLPTTGSSDNDFASKTILRFSLPNADDCRNKQRHTTADRMVVDLAKDDIRENYSHSREIMNNNDDVIVREMDKNNATQTTTTDGDDCARETNSDGGYCTTAVVVVPPPSPSEQYPETTANDDPCDEPMDVTEDDDSAVQQQRHRSGIDDVPPSTTVMSSWLSSVTIGPPFCLAPGRPTTRLAESADDVCLSAASFEQMPPPADARSDAVNAQHEHAAVGWCSDDDEDDGGGGGTVSTSSDDDSEQLDTTRYGRFKSHDVVVAENDEHCRVAEETAAAAVDCGEEEEEEEKEEKYLMHFELDGPTDGQSSYEPPQSADQEPMWSDSSSDNDEQEEERRREMDDDDDDEPLHYSSDNDEEPLRYSSSDNDEEPLRYSSSDNDEQEERRREMDSDDDDEPLRYSTDNEPDDDEPLRYFTENEDQEEDDEEAGGNVVASSSGVYARSDSSEESNRDDDDDCHANETTSGQQELCTDRVHDAAANPIRVLSSFSLAEFNNDDDGHRGDYDQRQDDDDHLQHTDVVHNDDDTGTDNVCNDNGEPTPRRQQNVCTATATTLDGVGGEEDETVDDMPQPTTGGVHGPDSFLFGQRLAGDASDGGKQPVLLFGRAYSLQSDDTATRAAAAASTTTLASITCVSTTTDSVSAFDCNTSVTETSATTTSTSSNTLENVNAEETESHETAIGCADDTMKDIVELKSLPDSSNSYDDDTEETLRRSRSCSLQSSSSSSSESSRLVIDESESVTTFGSETSRAVLDDYESTTTTSTLRLVSPRPDCTDATTCCDEPQQQQQSVICHDTGSQPFVLLVNCDWQTATDGGGGGAVEETRDKSSSNDHPRRDSVDGCGSTAKSCQSLPEEETAAAAAAADVTEKTTTRRRRTEDDKRRTCTPMPPQQRSKRAKASAVCCPCQFWPSAHDHAPARAAKKKSHDDQLKKSSSGGGLAELGGYRDEDVHKLTNAFVLLDKLPAAAATPTSVDRRQTEDHRERRDREEQMTPAAAAQKRRSRGTKKPSIPPPVDDDIFRSSAMAPLLLAADGSRRQRRVPLSTSTDKKKTWKSHEDLAAAAAQPKKRVRRSKSWTTTTAAEQQHAPRKQSVLEQIPEEETAKDVVVRAAVADDQTPKSKFNFVRRRQRQADHRQRRAAAAAETFGDILAAVDLHPMADGGGGGRTEAKKKRSECRLGGQPALTLSAVKDHRRGIKKSSSCFDLMKVVSTADDDNSRCCYGFLPALKKALASPSPPYTQAAAGKRSSTTTKTSAARHGRDDGLERGSVKSTASNSSFGSTSSKQQIVTRSMSRNTPSLVGSEIDESTVEEEEAATTYRGDEYPRHGDTAVNRAKSAVAKPKEEISNK